jgi:beta-lactamase class A
MLNRIVAQDKIHEVYHHLHLPQLAEAPNGYSPREYSVLYRALYNGTYLSRHLSEEALELLSNSTFRSGLVAGVPPEIPVAHKFGVRDAADNPLEGSAYEELHDCGIVYYPDHPYFLCIMTRGENFADLEAVIAGLSKTTWDEVRTTQAGFRL